LRGRILLEKGGKMKIPELRSEKIYSQGVGPNYEESTLTFLQRRKVRGKPKKDQKGERSRRLSWEKREREEPTN